MRIKLESSFEIQHPDNVDVCVVLKINFKNKQFAIFTRDDEPCFMFQNKIDSEISNIQKQCSYKVVDMNIQVAECIIKALELAKKELS